MNQSEKEPLKTKDETIEQPKQSAEPKEKKVEEKPETVALTETKEAETDLKTSEEPKEEPKPETDVVKEEVSAKTEAIIEASIPPAEKPATEESETKVEEAIETAVETEVPEEVLAETVKESEVTEETLEETTEEIAEEVSVDTVAETESQPEVPEVEDKEEIKSEVETTDEVPAVKAEESAEEIVQEEQREISDDAKKPAPVDKEIAAEKDNADAEEDEHDEEHKDEIEEPIEETIEKYNELPREKLIELLEEAVEAGGLPVIKTKVALIKVAFLKATKEEKQNKLDAFIKEGGNREEYVGEEDPLEGRFKSAFDAYKRKKAKFNEDLELQKLKNLDIKKQILEELRELINSDETLKKTYDKFKELQTEWKNIGLVPATEVNNLWQNYHFLVEKFFDKVRINKELRDLDLKKNLELKIELCERAEELLLETSIIKSFKQLQKYHEEWKDIGPVPNDKREEIWDRFKSATDKINERRREHYNNLSDQQEQNFIAKSALCENAEQILAEEITSVKEWQKRTEEIDELFKIWKTIGPAPKKSNDEVWERFRGYLNTFFANKKEFFSELKQEQLNNFNLKLDLCQQAEAIKDNEDWKETTNELINLQKEWKKIGPVPRKHSDKIWKRFRAACDEFFEKKQEFFANVGDREKENLDKKLELIEKVKTHKFDDDKSKNLEVLKGFQREWTNIGHVPIREKDKLQNDFREAIDKHLDALDISSVEMRTLDFKARMDHMKDDPNSDRILRKEINFLSGKISKLKEDINLWENNIGFLAQSKRADLLKAEFVKKIDKAKEDLALHEAKLKYLYQQQ